MKFGMYTAEGDRQVQLIVDRARRNIWTWPMTYGALRQLSSNHADVAGEATDTAVRECVYASLGFVTPFYI